MSVLFSHARWNRLNSLVSSLYICCDMDPFQSKSLLSIPWPTKYSDLEFVGVRKNLILGILRMGCSGIRTGCRTLVLKQPIWFCKRFSGTGPLQCLSLLTPATKQCRCHSTKGCQGPGTVTNKVFLNRLIYPIHPPLVVHNLSLYNDI